MSLARTIHESINTGFLATRQSNKSLVEKVEFGNLTADF